MYKRNYGQKQSEDFELVHILATINLDYLQVHHYTKNTVNYTWGN